ELVVDEVRVGNARVARRGRKVGRLLANDMVGATAVVSDQRRLNRPCQAAVKTEKRYRANPVPACEHIRLISRKWTGRPHVGKWPQIAPRLIISRESHRNLDHCPVLTAVVAVRADAVSDFSPEVNDIVAPGI